MKIILIHTHGGNGEVAFVADRFLHAPARKYQIVDGVVTLSGYDPDILHHDCQELLQHPGYRMPTPAEQEQLAKAEQEASIIQEEAIPIVSSEEEIDGEEKEEDTQSSTEPPAVQEKPKRGRPKAK